jgi:Zn-dependent peptidase ImmA (M78 family)
MFLCSSIRSKLIPRLLIPKDENHNNSWISIEKYRIYVIPLIIDLYSYHVTCIRETLLEYFNSYWQLIDQTILVNTILPQVDFILNILLNFMMRFFLACLWT